MRICIVVPYDVAEEGGVKRHAFHLAESMRGKGDEVTVVGPLSRGAAEAGFKGFGGVVNVPANGAANRVALLTPPWTVARFFRGSDFDVVHIHEPLVPLLPYYALWFSPRAAHVCTFHMYSEEEQGSAWGLARGALARGLRHRFERGIAVSRLAASYAARFWPSPLTVIPNGVSTATFRPPERVEEAAGRGRPWRLLFVGNWRDARKGLPHLLAAYDRLSAAGLSLRLDVVGEGEPAVGERPGVVFHGPVSSEAVLSEHYRRCDLFVAPTTGRESFGIVLLEAMASARPILCSDIAGYRQVIDSGGARLVPPGNVEELARGISELAGQPELCRQMGALNRQRAGVYEWDGLARQVREEYVAAIAARQGTDPAPVIGSGPGDD